MIVTIDTLRRFLLDSGIERALEELNKRECNEGNDTDDSCDKGEFLSIVGFLLAK